MFGVGGVHDANNSAAVRTAHARRLTDVHSVWSSQVIALVYCTTRTARHTTHQALGSFMTIQGASVMPCVDGDQPQRILERKRAEIWVRKSVVRSFHDCFAHHVLE